uniref:Protein kinase domain-containing protein n=1 Tax=Grammatophora oceanica TaxID=210454 RepID=A0A7S1YI40_9STRA|mmetsp:Transcript_52441/g.78346  ORF Transcript_52441/g.78346 Transcript_52441/m.78346 type:complete len:302 (+) Transcript_52441:566-1471(+)
MDDGKETFWAVRILRTSIEDGYGGKNLSIVLRFIADALEKLDSWRGQSRVQYKIPMPLEAQDDVKAVAQYCGENVTIIEEASGSTFVYKEYSYHLRQACDFSDFMLPLFVIEETDQRQPPPNELLTKLGTVYTEWKVHEGPFGSSVLRYPFIEGSCDSPSVTGWLEILLLIQKMHEIDFVHGDLLPRNVIFDTAGRGYVIDFDLSRKAGDKDVRGYNHLDFREFRHDGAKAGEEMTKDHDLHSLREMSNFFFELEQSTIRDLNLGGLIEFFRAVVSKPGLGWVGLGELNDEASGSPMRRGF